MTARTWQRGYKDYVVIVELGRDAEGKRKTKWYSGFETKKAADREANRIITEMEEGQYTKPEKITVGEWLDHWVEDYAKLRTGQRTYEWRKSAVVQHLKPAFGSTLLQKLDTPAVQKQIAKWAEKDARRTIKWKVDTLSMAMKQAMAIGMLKRDPTDAVVLPPAKGKEIRALAPEQVNTVLKAIEGTNLYAPAFLAVNTGMRLGEILALRWDDIDDNQINVRYAVERVTSGARLKEPKTAGSRRTITIDDATVAMLKEHKKRQAEQRLGAGRVWVDNGYVFPRGDGKLLSPNGISSRYGHEVLRKTKIKTSFHELRHTHATLLLSSGAPLKVVSERLGHASAAITMGVYAHVLPGQEAMCASIVGNMLAGGLQK